VTLKGRVKALERKAGDRRPDRALTERLELYRQDPARLMADAGFTPDPWQVQLLRSTDPRVLLLCSRQVGKSTTTAMLALKTALTEPGSTTVIAAPVEEQANELLRKVVQGFNALGRPVPVVREAVTFFELANGSRVLALPGKERRMRSYTSALLIVDEAARVTDDVFHAASPTTAVSRGRVVMLSTAFAKSGHFYREWQEGTGYKRLSITAFDCPRISQQFLAEERRKLGERWFQMEYCNVFGDDVAAVFSTADIRAAMDPCVVPLFGTGPVRTGATDAEITPLFGVAP
jgi:hypothetical protein